ncbi:ABC transporter substrate-binding protein [Aliiroseovarius sp. 2305UL8-7]|uniref:ABC transporter substrate-binding protein n=1 Tax=Aliiroseovarius conchicola TaxID=3121637 RepID=UPI0035295A80
MKLGTIAIAALTASALSAEADTTLTYFSWDPTQLEVEKAAIAEFEASHPGVKVEAQALPPKDYWPRLSAQAASGDLPDVFMMSSGFVKEWAAAGNLLDISDLVSDEQLSNFYAGAASVGEIDGKRVAFPQNWVAPVLYYNETAFEEAGIEPPSADWTWDDFLAAAKALTVDKDGNGSIDQYGYWVYGRYAHLEPWVFRNGGRYVNDDETAIELNDEAKSALQFVTGLTTEHKVAPQPQELEGVRQQDVFGLGMAAMWVDGSWNIANNREIVGDAFKWNIAQVPMGPDATPETAKAYAWADMLSIGEGSENAELAWEFIQHMSGGGRSASDFLGGKVPAYKEIATSEAWLEKDQMPANKGILLEIGAQPTYTGFTKS